MWVIIYHEYYPPEVGDNISRKLPTGSGERGVCGCPQVGGSPLGNSDLGG